MRDQYNVFHLAIPCKDLDETVEFYVFKLGCKLARRYADRVTVDFFGDQLVCHLEPESIDQNPKLYPRHFGITFRDKIEFDNAPYHKTWTPSLKTLLSQDLLTQPIVETFYNT